MNTSRIPVFALAILFAVGCYYALFGVISIAAGVLNGYKLWWLEFIFALLCVWAGVRVFARVEKTTLTTDHAERAIWRLAYRKGWNLNFKEILANTMLDEPTALNALKSLEQKQQVKLEPDGTWTLLKTT